MLNNEELEGRLLHWQQGPGWFPVTESFGYSARIHHWIADGRIVTDAEAGERLAQAHQRKGQREEEA